MSDRNTNPVSPGITPGNSNNDESIPNGVGRFSTKKIRRGLFFFIVVTIIALTGVFLYSNTDVSVGALKHLQGKYIILVCVLSLADMTLGAFRNHIYFIKMKAGLKFSVSFRANLANIFMGAVTPSQSGGGPAQLYVYHKAGVSLGKSVSVSILNIVATLTFFIAAAGYSLHTLSSSFNKPMYDLIIFCFVVFSIMLLVFIIIVWKPGHAIILIDKLALMLSSRFPKQQKKVSKISNSIIREVTAYKSSCRLFLRDFPYIPILAFAITCILYLNKFILAYFIMRGLGAHGDFTTVLCIQALVLFISYFSPTPGASGIAEVSIAVLMASVMNQSLLGIFTLLQRFFILYIPVILGGFVIAWELRNSGADLKHSTDD